MSENSINQSMARFITSLKDPNLDEILKSLKPLEVTINNQSENFDLYMIEKVLPVLFSGLEELSREVERYQTAKDINPEIRERFNPCIFLGQYLMRNNPKYKNNNEKQMIEDYVRKEKCMRFFKEKNENFINIFYKTIKTKKSKCPYSELKFFANEIDNIYDLKGELREYLLGYKTFLHSKDEKKDIDFEEIMKAFGEYTAVNRKVDVAFLMEKQLE